MADTLENASGAPKQTCITSNALTGPLQRYLLPQLTLDAAVVLRTTCKTLFQLIITAPFSSLQLALQTLLPPGVKHCATDSQSMKALLKVQRRLQQCVQAGAEARPQLLSVPDLETPGSYHWEGAKSPSWALESPCRKLVLECILDVDDVDQMLMDPCDLLASLGSPAASQFSGEHNPFMTFLEGGALVEASSGLAILNMETQESTSTWKCPQTDSSLDCQAALNSGLICVTASTLLSGSDWRWQTRMVAVLKQCSLQELLVVTPPSEPRQKARAASRFWLPLVVQCRWVQPSPDQQLVGLWWSDEAGCSYSRLCIFSLPNAKLVADIDCHAVCRASAIHLRDAEWSPDSTQILFPRFQHSHSQHLLHGIMIVNVTGSYKMLATSVTSLKLESSWSADGQYVYIDSIIGASRGQPDQARSAGTVWRAETGEEVLSWENPHGRSHAVWSPVGSSIFLPDLTLVTLPVNGSSADIIRQSYHGPQSFNTGHHSSAFTFSPSGSTLVGALHTHVSNSPFQLPQELWHADCSLQCASSSLKAIAADTSGWRMTSILWNPSPWASHVYAILTGSGSLHLIDAAQHKPLRSWSKSELVGPVERYQLDTFSLSWSPDGSQLLALGGSCIILLTFGPAVSIAPKDA